MASTGEYSSSGEVLLGGYDPVKRRDEVSKRLQLSFEAIRKENIHKTVGASGSQSSNSSRSLHKGGDVTSIKLENILSEVDILATNVEDFRGVHFTKVYRTLQGDCTKFQSDLDRLEVTGREDLRTQRRDAIVRIEKLARQLAAKTHSDGKPCKDCEVQD